MAIEKKRRGPQHRWTEEELAIVRRDFRGTHESCREIGARLGVSQHAVRGQVHKMGLAKHNERRPWSEAEKERLAELVPVYSVGKIAKLMKRSVNSVVIQARRINASRRDRFGWYTKGEVSEILGQDHHWVQRRIDSGTLKASYHDGERPGQDGQKRWHISERDLKHYLRRYPQELSGRNVDLVQVVNILAGVPPID